MKKMITLLGFVALLATTQNANALTTTYADKALNWPGWTATHNNLADPLGTPSFTSTTVTVNNGNLDKIVFNGSGITSHNAANYEVFSGDLFINVLNSAGDTTWDYVVRGLGTALNNTSRSLALYKTSVGLNNTAAYELSSYHPYTQGNTSAHPISDTSIRSGLPVGLLGIDQRRDTLIGDVDFSSTASSVTFDFDDLYLGADFIIGYTVTCANDVIYQHVPVPEPSTIVLLGAGLLGLGFYGRRKAKK